jgi:hypothetical protein
MRVAFLVDETQLPRARAALAVCSALMRSIPWVDACLIAPNDQVAAEIRWRHGNDMGRSVELFVFQESWMDSLLGRMGRGTYRKNLDFFRSLDALVVFDSRPLILKTRYGLDHIKIIRWLPDEDGVLSSEMALFDHILVSGIGTRDRLTRETRVAPDQVSVIEQPGQALFARAARAIGHVIDGHSC